MDLGWLQKAKVGMIIPTYQAGPQFSELLKEISRQNFQPQYKLIVDSGSTDDTVNFARDAGWQVKSIAKTDFSHGKTRQDALEELKKQAEIDFVIYMTQDVRIPKTNSLANLLAVFSQTDVAAAYGRQLPHRGASIYAAVDREFNYPAKSIIKSITDAKTMGIKATFLSNSFAAYRIKDMTKCGGFRDIDICEDMDIAGRLLLNNRKIAYVAEAEVCHSHELNFSMQWKRYRSMGRFYTMNPWIKEQFGTATSEGMKLVLYQLKRVQAEKGLCGVAKIFVSDVVKLIAHRLGRISSAIL